MIRKLTESPDLLEKDSGEIIEIKTWSLPTGRIHSRYEWTYNKSLRSIG